MENKIENKKTNKLQPVLILGLVAGGFYLFTRKAEAHPEDIMLSGLVIIPSEVYVGQLVSISLTATNMGSEIATKELNCEVI